MTDRRFYESDKRYRRRYHPREKQQLGCLLVLAAALFAFGCLVLPLSMGQVAFFVIAFFLLLLFIFGPRPRLRDKFRQRAVEDERLNQYISEDHYTLHFIAAWSIFALYLFFLLGTLRIIALLITITLAPLAVIAFWFLRDGLFEVIIDRYPSLSWLTDWLYPQTNIHKEGIRWYFLVLSFITLSLLLSYAAHRLLHLPGDF